MIFRGRIALMICSFSFLLVGCYFDISGPKENEDAPLIRKVLRANGITIADNESVEKYLYYSPYVGQYYIVLPQGQSRSIILTDDITVLTMVNYKTHRSNHLLVGFAGITSLANDRYDVTIPAIDSVMVKTDSVVVIPKLNLVFKNKITVDHSIGKLRTWFAVFKNRSDSLQTGYAKILPVEVMNLSTAPYYYDSLIVDISNVGPIDSTNDSLPSWLLKYGGNGAPLH